MIPSTFQKDPMGTRECRGAKRSGVRLKGHRRGDGATVQRRDQGDRTQRWKGVRYMATETRLWVANAQWSVRGMDYSTAHLELRQRS